MSDFHVTENAMAETGKTTNTGDIDLPYARSADQIRALVVAHESSPAAASGLLEKRNETKLSA
jgi:hypothetical protein